jgi:hypothetical protein
MFRKTIRLGIWRVDGAVEWKIVNETVLLKGTEFTKTAHSSILSLRKNTHTHTHIYIYIYTHNINYKLYI